MVNVIALAQKPKTSTLIVDSDLNMGTYNVSAANITATGKLSAYSRLYELTSNSAITGYQMHFTQYGISSSSVNNSLNHVTLGETYNIPVIKDDNVTMYKGSFYVKVNSSYGTINYVTLTKLDGTTVQVTPSSSGVVDSGNVIFKSVVMNVTATGTTVTSILWNAFGYSEI